MVLRGRYRITDLVMVSVLLTPIFLSAGMNSANAANSKPGLTAVCVNLKTGLAKVQPRNGCNSKTEKGVYLTDPEMIFVNFAGGSSTPTNVKSISPKYWDGLLCRPQQFTFTYAVDFGGVIPSPIGQFVTGRNWAGTAKQVAYRAASTNTQDVYIYDHCTTNTVFYACRPAGGIDEGSDGKLNQCNAVVRKTTVKQLGYPFGLIAGSDPNGPLSNSAEVIIFYCGDRDKLIAPPAAPLIGCIRPQ